MKAEKEFWYRYGAYRENGI